jgi:RNA polymerase sigma-54 factor
MGQQLTMTPQLQQAIRLLQLSTLDLQAEIQEALESNPMLETSEPDSQTENTDTDNDGDSGKNEAETAQATTSQETANDTTELDSEWQNEIPQDLPVDTQWDDIYQGSSSSAPVGPERDDSYFDSQMDNSETLQDHLLWQLNLTPLNDTDRTIAHAIIDSVAPSGILTNSISEIFEGLTGINTDAQSTDDATTEAIPADAEEDGLGIDEVYAVQHRLQQFDPIGCCSEDLGQCLLVQLQQYPATTEQLDSAKVIVSQYLNLLGAKDYKQIMRKCRLKEAELKVAISLIQQLTPHPGELIGSSDTSYIVPDVFVSKKNERWVVELNPDIAPRLRINDSYASLVKRADNSDDNTFLRDNLQEARWFLKSLQSRNETLLKVASCIVDKQQGFLEHGPEAMRPLVLHDIAEDVGMHESTISRVTTQKYMHTPKGIFELKFFFSSHVSTENGGECSSTAIRAIIKKLVAAEDPRKPLSDSKITALLSEQGIKVARRTIAKYRESLGIVASNERKQLV